MNKKALAIKYNRRQKHRNTEETEKLPTNKQTRPEQRDRKSADGAILKCN